MQVWAYIYKVLYILFSFIHRNVKNKFIHKCHLVPQHRVFNSNSLQTSLDLK